MDPSLALETVFSDDLSTIHRAGSLVALVWHDTPTADRMVPTTQALASLVRPRASTTVLCAISAAGRPLPDSATRAALREGIQRLGDLRAAVNVILGSGFHAAAMRSLLSGFVLFLRPRYPVTFVGSEAEAASEIITHWPESDPTAPSHAALAEALSAVRPAAPQR